MAKKVSFGAKPKQPKRNPHAGSHGVRFGASRKRQKSSSGGGASGSGGGKGGYKPGSIIDW